MKFRVILTVPLLLINLASFSQDNSNYFFEKGLAESNKKNYLEALQLFNRALEIDSTNTNALNYRGVLKYELNDPKGAYIDYSKALLYSKGTTKLYIIYSNRSQSLNALKRYDDAIDDCNQALREKPDEKVSLLNRGIAFDKLKKYDLAIADFHAGIKIDSTFSKNYSSLGLTLYHQSKYNDAIIFLDKAINLDTSYAMAYHWKGLINGQLNKKQESIECFTKALTHNPKLIEARVMRGILYSEMNKKDLACIDFEKSLILTRETDKIKLINEYIKNICN